MISILVVLVNALVKILFNPKINTFNVFEKSIFQVRRTIRDSSGTRFDGTTDEQRRFQASLQQRRYLDRRRKLVDNFDAGCQSCKPFFFFGSKAWAKFLAKPPATVQSHLLWPPWATQHKNVLHHSSL